MKVPPKRKGNGLTGVFGAWIFGPSMKVPPKRKGNCGFAGARDLQLGPSMKVPPKRKGNLGAPGGRNDYDPLNESPSEKEGKYPTPKPLDLLQATLNESPSEKEGKCEYEELREFYHATPSMKVPPKRKGNNDSDLSVIDEMLTPSMKVPPKRKGNSTVPRASLHGGFALNESPSEKEGKYVNHAEERITAMPSMKVPPKRKGNIALDTQGAGANLPSMKVPPKRKGNRNHG